MSIKILLRTAFAVLVLSLSNVHAAPIELISNGNFETGTLAGWTLANINRYGNSFYAIANGANVPVSHTQTTLNPGGGSFVAVSDQNGAGGETLIQTFTKAANAVSMSLSFDWFDNTHAGFSGNKINGSQQVGRVDILTSGSGAFDVQTGVVENILLNAGTYTNFGQTIPWENISVDLSALAPGTYQLRFANGQNAFYQEFGVDNVSLLETVPEPATLALFGFGLFGFAVSRRRVGNNKNI